MCQCVRPGEGVRIRQKWVLTEIQPIKLTHLRCIHQYVSSSQNCHSLVFSQAGKASEVLLRLARLLTLGGGWQPWSLALRLPMPTSTPADKNGGCTLLGHPWEIQTLPTPIQERNPHFDPSSSHYRNPGQSPSLSLRPCGACGEAGPAPPETSLMSHKPFHTRLVCVWHQHSTLDPNFAWSLSVQEVAVTRLY